MRTSFLLGSLLTSAFLFCNTAVADPLASELLDIIEEDPSVFDALSLEDQFLLMDVIEGNSVIQDPQDPKSNQFFDLLTSKGKKKKCIEWKMTISREYDGVSQGDQEVELDEPNSDGTKWDVDGPWWTDGEATLTDNGDGSMGIDFELRDREIDISIGDDGKTSAEGKFPDQSNNDKNSFDSEGTATKNSDGSITFDLEGTVKNDGKKKKLKLTITLECEEYDS